MQARKPLGDNFCSKISKAKFNLLVYCPDFTKSSKEKKKYVSDVFGVIECTILFNSSSILHDFIIKL